MEQTQGNQTRNCENVKLSVRINEDGTITRLGFSSQITSEKSNVYTERPEILKFYLSSTHLTCGETIKLCWAVSNAQNCFLTIRQGEHDMSSQVEDSGELDLSSNIATDDIIIEINCKNSAGQANLRRTISVKKKKNEVKSNIGATIVTILIIIVITAKIISIF